MAAWLILPILTKYFSMYTPKDSFAGIACTPANETADLVSLNMAAPVRTVSDMRDNPKTLNSSDVYIYNCFVT